MNGVLARKALFLAISIAVIAGAAGGAAYIVAANGSPANSSALASGSHSASDQACLTYQANWQPNLFGQQVSSVKQVTLSENYTNSQLQRATEVALNDSLVQTLVLNRTSVDYSAFQGIRDGGTTPAGGIYAVTTDTGYVQNGSSLIPITAGGVLTQYRLCGTTLYQVWTPQGILVRVLLSPSVTTVAPSDSQAPVTIGEVDLTVNTTLWSVVGTGTSPAASA